MQVDRPSPSESDTIALTLFTQSPTHSLSSRNQTKARESTCERSRNLCNLLSHNLYESSRRLWKGKNTVFFRFSSRRILIRGVSAAVPLCLKIYFPPNLLVLS